MLPDEQLRAFINRPAAVTLLVHRTEVPYGELLTELIEKHGRIRVPDKA